MLTICQIAKFEQALIETERILCYLADLAATVFNIVNDVNKPAGVFDIQN